MSNSNSSSVFTGGIDVVGVLGVVFVVLKLTGLIDWSWWLVTLPFWVGFVIVLVVFIFAFIFSILRILKKSKK